MKLKYLAILLLATSCAPTIKNFDKFQKQFMTKSSILPNEELLNGK